MIHHIYANRSNAGDWLSARGIQALLAPLAITEHFCDTPFVPETVAALERATARDFIVIGGGGLFMDYFAPFWEKFHPIAQRVPFCIWGAGYCDPKFSSSRTPLPVLADIVGLSQLCVVRDELTRGKFPQHALPTPVPCTAMVAVPTTTQPHQRQVLHVDHYDNVGAEGFERMQRIAAEFARRTGRSTRRTNNLLPKSSEPALHAILELYAAAEVVLTSRLHGCIIGLATGRPVIAVSGDAKVDSFMQAAGMTDWMCDVAQLDQLPALLERFAEQEFPHAFVAAARAANRAVAQQVKALAAAAAQR